MPAPAGAPRRLHKTPARTCVGCRSEDSPKHMVRLVLAPDGRVVPDLGASQFGRGAWLHPRPDCVRKAAPRGLAKSFRAQIITNAEELTRALGNAADARAIGLLAAARRAGLLAVGSTSVKEALNRGAASLVVVATDARAAAATPWIEKVVAEGRAVAWGTKDVIGSAAGRPLAGVVAILDNGFAMALSQVIAISQMPVLAAERGTRRVTEVG